MQTAAPTASQLEPVDLHRVEQALLTALTAGVDHTHAIETLLRDAGPQRREIEQLLAAAVADTDANDRNRALARMLD